ncbi:MAG: hypothetical protein ABSG67_14005 [Thermoguttaceae bacterium]
MTIVVMAPTTIVDMAHAPFSQWKVESSSSPRRRTLAQGDAFEGENEPVGFLFARVWEESPPMVAADTSPGNYSKRCLAEPTLDG